MKGKFNPKSALDELLARDKKLIGLEFEWTDIGGYKDSNGNPRRMLAPPKNAGFSFGWTLEEDVEAI
ncbi:MAG: hypothetical protein V3R78_12480 [Thermodesulfobacteriota bacterium]